MTGADRGEKWVEDPAGLRRFAVFARYVMEKQKTTVRVAGKEYALRFVVDTISGLPYYFNYRVFEITGLRFDNFTTRRDNTSVCEVIITGVFKRPRHEGLAPWAVMQLKDDKSNLEACNEFLNAAENL